MIQLLLGMIITLLGFLINDKLGDVEINKTEIQQLKNNYSRIEVQFEKINGTLNLINFRLEKEKRK